MRRFTLKGLLCFLFVLGTTHFFGFEEEGFFGVTAANARFVARKEEEASLDFGGETVTEVPTLTTSSSVYGKKKKKKKKNDGMKKKKKEEEDDDESVEVPTLSSAYGKKKKKNNNNNTNGVVVWFPQRDVPLAAKK